MAVPIGPNFFIWVEKFYAALAKASVTEQLGRDKVKVFRGRVTRAFADAEIPLGYYSKVTQLLKVMGCVHQLSRGGGRYGETELILLAAPTYEGFEEAVKVLDPTEPIEWRREKMLKVQERSARRAAKR